MKNIIKLVYTIILMVSITFISCDEGDLVQTLEDAKEVEGNITTFEDLDNLVSSVYSWMTSSSYNGNSLNVYGDIRTDNAYNSSAVSTYEVFATNTTTASTWSTAYRAISTANLAIISGDVTGDPAKINQKIGEAYALRALVHFDLLRLYGQQFVQGEGGMNSLGIIYANEFQSSDLYLARRTVAETKLLIEEDLIKSLTLMTPSLNDPSKKYMTTNGVKAIQARIALYFKEFSKARDYAKEVIDSKQYSIVPLNQYINSWKTESNDNTIFELAYDTDDNLSTSSLSYAYRHQDGSIYVYDEVLDIFDKDDIRIDTLMIHKDKRRPLLLRNVGKFPSEEYTDDIAIIRYEEIVLIYAEGLLKAGGGDPLVWLNKIPAQRNATLYTLATKENILLERRKELLFEGFRFDDLARTSKDIPLTSLEDATPIPFGDFRYAFPIPPAGELRRNVNAVQNKGYSN